MLLCLPAQQTRLCAQTFARIAGSVLDQNGSPVAGATIAVRGSKLAVQRDLITDSTGLFTVPDLPPDTYQLAASCPICSDVSSIVEVGAGQTRVIQMGVDTNSATSTVSLETTGSTMDATSAKVGLNVAAAEIAALPVNGRALAPLALAAPFVANLGGALFSDLHFASQSAQQNHYLLDNIDDSSVVSAEPGFTPLYGYEFRLRNSLDAVDEFRVDSLGYSAEDGFGNGGQIKLISKSGTAELHGSLFEYFRNDQLDARNFFDLEKKNELQMNQYGGNLGGPIVKDKLFGFVSFEQLRQRSGMNITENVPSAALRQQAVPSILPVLNAIPSGTRHTADPQSDQVTWVGSSTQNESNFSARLDYFLSAKNRFFLRYSQSDGQIFTPDYSTTSRFIQAVNKSDQSVLSWSSQPTAGLSHQLNLGVNRSPTTVSATTAFRSLAGTSVAIGSALVSDFASPGDQLYFSGGNFGNYLSYRGRTYNVNDTLDWTKGSHFVQAGVTLQAVRLPLQISGGMHYSYSDLGSFLSNQDAELFYSADLTPREAERENWGGYLQDSIHLNTGVQLVLGLRYEYFSATREAQNHAIIFDPFTFATSPAKGGFYNASKLGFQPRLAVTWSPKVAKGKSVFRFGAGLYNGPNGLIATLMPIENTASRYFLHGPAYPTTSSDLLASPTKVSELRGLDAGTFGLPQRNILTTASFQQVLPYRLVAEMAYAGILSRHLAQLNLSNVNTGVDPNTGALLRPEKSYSPIPYSLNGGNSSYQALRLDLNRHLVDNLSVQMAFNLGHSIGNADGVGDEQFGSNPFCGRCDRSDNNFDIRRTTSVNLVYASPFGKGHPYLKDGWLGSLLGNWTVAAIGNLRSGLPLNVQIDRADQIYYSSITRRYYSPSVDRPADAIAVINAPGDLELLSTLRPDYVSGVNPYSQGSLQWLNPAAFAIPAPGRAGNLGRNALRGPGFQQFDFQLGRTLPVTEKLHLQIKAEAFNLFNHANFSNPLALLPDATVQLQPGEPYARDIARGFGTIHSTIGKNVGLGTSRQIQFSARFEF